MSSQVDLTIIAIAVGLMAILAVVVVWVLLRMLLHLMALERAVTTELQSLGQELRDILNQVKHTSSQVTETVGRFTRTAAWVGRMASLVIALSDRSRRATAELPSKTPDPSWWLTGLNWAWSLWSKSRRAKTGRQRQSGPPAL